MNLPERGKSRSGHGISFTFNREDKHHGAKRDAQRKRNTAHKQARAEWSRAIRENDRKEIPFPTS